MSALRAELVAKLIEKYGWEQAVTETAVAEFIEKVSWFVIAQLSLSFLDVSHFFS